MKKRLLTLKDRTWENIFSRAERNINRILEMQYEIEDILRERNYRTYHMLSTLLDACTDELEVLISAELGKEDAAKNVRRRIEELFGPREAISEEIRLDNFIKDKIEQLRSMFAHRKCKLVTKIESVQPISIP